MDIKEKMENSIEKKVWWQCILSLIPIVTRYGFSVTLQKRSIFQNKVSSMTRNDDFLEMFLFVLNETFFPSFL